MKETKQNTFSYLYYRFLNAINFSPLPMENQIVEDEVNIDLIRCFCILLKSGDKKQWFLFFLNNE